MKKYILISILLISMALPSAAIEFPGQPARHYGYQDWTLMGGYQMLFHPNQNYHVGTIQSEAIFSFFAARVSFTVGPNYMSFSPFGLLAFFPKLLAKSLKGDKAQLTMALIIGFCSAQWHIPVSDHLEFTVGWDALKFTRMKLYSDEFYLTGSLNACFTGYCTDNLFINAYYEFNHTHNPLIKLGNKLFGDIKEQPSYLMGHSFGVRVGWMF